MRVMDGGPTVARPSATTVRHQRATRTDSLNGVLSASETLGLTVEVATTADELLALKPDYDRLLLVSQNKLPFAMHEWHVAWCNHFLKAGKRVRIQRLFHVVRDAERRCVAIVPLMLTRRTIGPVKVDTLDLIGADPGITEIRAPLIEPGFESRVAWAVQRALATMRSVDWVQWSGISGAFGEALAVGAELAWEEPLLDYVLDLPATWEMLRANLKRNIRESIRHSYNSLKRDGIEFELRIAQDPAAVNEALEPFFALHALRARLAGTVKHGNVFAAECSRSFLREVCGRLAVRGMVRLFQLVINGEIVAARLGFVVQDSLYLYYSGFDPRWAEYGVMTTTLIETIKYAVGERLATVNFSTGKDVSKTRWGVREIQYARAVQVRRSRLSQFAWAGFKRARKEGARPSLLGRLTRPAARDWE
jgi:CelD/BcsL family acetyltransferase involved in cellulose biosynthesis